MSVRGVWALVVLFFLAYLALDTFVVDYDHEAERQLHNFRVLDQ